MHTILRSLIFTALFSLSFLGCGDDESNIGSPESEVNYSFNLTIEKNGREIILDWDDANYSTFQNYFIVRSTEEIPSNDLPVNPLDSIQESSSSRYVDDFYQIEGKLFYRVFVKIGGVFLESETVSVEFFDEIHPITASKVTHDEENDRLFIFDEIRYKVYRYEILNEQVTDSLELEPGGYQIKVGNAGMGMELFVSKIGTGKLDIYDAETFAFKEQLNAIGEVQSIEVSNGVVILAANQSNESLTVYNRETLEKISAGNSVRNIKRVIKLISDDPKILIDASNEELGKYVFDEDWTMLSEESIEWFMEPLWDIACIGDGEFFIPNTDGEIYNLNLERMDVQIGDVGPFASEHIFIEEEGEIYSFVFNNKFFAKISFPNLELIEFVSLKYKPLRAVRTAGNKMVVVGRLDDFQPGRTYFDVFEF